MEVTTCVISLPLVMSKALIFPARQRALDLSSYDLTITFIIYAYKYVGNGWCKTISYMFVACTYSPLMSCEMHPSVLICYLSAILCQFVNRLHPFSHLYIFGTSIHDYRGTVYRVGATPEKVAGLIIHNNGHEKSVCVQFSDLYTF